MAERTPLQDEPSRSDREARSGTSSSGPSDSSSPASPFLYGLENRHLQQRYRIIERIGIGGMAEVYLAAHGQLAGFQTPVVIKRVLPHLASTPEFIEMFLDEARIAAALHHPNIVTIMEVIREGNEYLLAMELVQGEPLGRILRVLHERHERLPALLAGHIAAQVAAGLHYAHTYCDANGESLNIVHRDVSPQNILISYEGAVKVIDFGVARALGRLTHTRTGGFKGKLGYSAPEQARRDEIDGRADQFALGVVLWEMVTGQRLFRRDTELETVNAILTQPPPPMRAFASVTPDLEATVTRALKKNPADRFASLQEMEVALTKCFGDEALSGPTELRGFMTCHFRANKAEWRRRLRDALEMTTPSLDPAATLATVLERRGMPGAASGKRPNRWPWMLWAALAVTVIFSALALALAYSAYRGTVPGATAQPPRREPIIAPAPVPATEVPARAAGSTPPVTTAPAVQSGTPPSANKAKTAHAGAKPASPPGPQKTGKKGAKAPLKPNPFRI